VVSLPDAPAGGASGERNFYFEEFIQVMRRRSTDGNLRQAQGPSGLLVR
jgi:hypothetical protein